MKTIYQNELKKYLSILFFSLICSFFHVFFVNFPSISKYLLTHDNQLLNAYFDLIISTLIISFFLSVSFSINILLTKYLVFLANFIALIYSYFVFHFGFIINQHIVISALFYSEMNDVYSAFDYWIFIYCLPSFIFLVLITNFLQKKLAIRSLFAFDNNSLKNYFKIVFLRLSYILTISLILILFINTNAYIVTYKLRTTLEQIMPSYFFMQIKEIMLTYKSSQHLNLKGYDDYKIKFNKNNNQEPLIVVIVVGELLRSDRLSVNGYHRETSPNLAKINNLLVFKDVLSCATSTTPSVLCMLTDENQKDFNSKFSSSTFEKKYSVGKIFSDLNFNVTVLSNANKDSGIYALKNFHAPDKVIDSSELRRKHLAKTSDYNDLIMLEEINNQINQNSLYILGTRGSHREYYSNYPRQFAKFIPDLGNSLTQINNSYDNTVFYFDNFFYQLTAKLSNNNAIIFYTSDHGESLGENNIFLHGYPVDKAPLEQRLVPMIIWMSDKYIAYNKTQFTNLKRNNQLNRNNNLQVRHDHFFHTILGCMNFKSNKIDNNLNLCH